MNLFMQINQIPSIKIKARFCDCIETLATLSQGIYESEASVKHIVLCLHLRSLQRVTQMMTRDISISLTCIVYLLFVGFFCPQKVEEQL